MDYPAILRHAWNITRRERGLWGFGLILAAGGLMTSLVFGLLYVAVFAMVVASDYGAATGAISWTLVSVLGWIERHAIAIVVAIVASFLVWTMVAVIEVAAAAGLITQADEALAGRPVSFSEGIAFGWRRWWRMAALYAVAALPSLASLLVQSMAVWYAIVLRGGPGEGGASVSMALNVVQPLSSVLSLVSIPVGALVVFAYRFALLHDLDWKSSLSASLRLLKSRFFEVAGLYVVVWLVSAGVGIAAALLLAMVGGAGVVVAIVALRAESIALALAVGGAALLLALLVQAGVTAALGIFMNVAYNSGWRSLMATIPAVGEAGE